MATPNYSFEKRRRELEKKAKKEEKRKHKLEVHAAAKEGGSNSEPPADEAPQASDETPL
jgi:hypothetical protein